jgi:hypothetical protein
MRFALPRNAAMFTALFALAICMLYSAGGALQGAMLFTENKAVLNWNRWGALTIILAATIVTLFARATKFEVPRLLRVVLCTVALLLASYFVYGVVERELRIDSCLDRGGTFNYAKDDCSNEDTFAGLAFFDYQGARVTFVVVLFVFAFSGIRSLIADRTTSTN